MATPDFAFVEGWDQYGETGDLTYSINNELLQRYNAVSVAATQVNYFLIAPLSGTGGNALRINHTGSGREGYCRKTLPGNYARAVGGITLRGDTSAISGTGSNKHGVQFWDGATRQLQIVVNSVGRIEVWRGGTFAAGTLIATSVESVAANSINVIEYDVTIHNTTGIIKVWLNSTLTSLNLTGQNTRATANSYYNAWSLSTDSASSAMNADFDHEYLFCYTASGGAETPLLYLPLVETQFPSADDTAQFNVGSAVVGKDYRTTTATNAPGANFLVLVKVRPEVNMTLGSIGLVPSATSVGAKFKAVAYSDSAGAPNALLATGTEVIGCTIDTVLSLPGLAQALVGGTDYWIGYITDTSVAIHQFDSTTNLGRKIANTYASGAPGTAGAMTTGVPSWQIWGICSSAAANYAGVNKRLATVNEYNSELTVGDKDLFTFPALSITPAAIALMSVSITGAKTDGGARTVDCLVKSGASSSTGTLAAQAPAISLFAIDSNFWTDPNTGVAWDGAGVNAAKTGYDIAA